MKEIIGLRNAIWLSLGLWTLIFACEARAQQQPSADPAVVVLTSDFQRLAQSLQALIAAHGKGQADVAKALADAEAREATLIQWLKSAQAKEAVTAIPPKAAAPGK